MEERDDNDLDRREFLELAAGAAAGYTLAGSAAEAAPSDAKPETKPKSASNRPTNPTSPTSPVRKESAPAPPKPNPSWPVLTRYDQDHLRRIALPLGGIGTGTVSLGGRGDLRDWEIINRPNKGFAPDRTFFALRWKEEGGEPAGRCLEGPVDEADYEGTAGSRARNASLPRFRHCEFLAAYPFGQVLLSDPDVPLDARIEGFNPLVPADAGASGLPVAILRFVLMNKTDKPVEATVCGTIENFLGGPNTKDKNTFRAADEATALHGLLFEAEGVDPQDESYGAIALATTAKGGVSRRSEWRGAQWNTDLIDFWDDLLADGELTENEPAAPRRRGGGPRGSLAVKIGVPPRGEQTATFLIAWRFPNRMTWAPAKDETAPAGENPNRVGNYYATKCKDAWDAASQAAAKLPKLEADTLAFVKAFCDSDLPHAVKEAALFNLSTLRSQTCFRTEDGRFFGWEGCNDNAGCCMGSCTHVWNYEQATAFLFGDLARSMREIEFLHATDERGLMSFRVQLPLARARQWRTAAADGQMGCLMKLYRDWQLSGDEEMLRRLWPMARKALEFCWIEGGWDGDRDGVMEGCQHNTMDVEYYGPNPQMEGWYLGALRAAEEMARRMGEREFADQCRRLFENGSRWTDEHLFNGEYYEQEIRPPAGPVAEGLRAARPNAPAPTEPTHQIGAGCLVDQLVGQYMAHVCGLGYLLNRSHVRETLQSVKKYNGRENLFGHFNPMRTYALNDESALLMASYPRGNRPKHPFPYYGEAMTGFEYVAAIGMLFEGQTDAGLQCIEAIRKRYDGEKRSPFDEAECGHHYARAMASWAAVVALTGFHYSAVDGSIAFAANEGTHFWSNGGAWGTCNLKPVKGGMQAVLAVQHGSLKVRRFALSNFGETRFEPAKEIAAGQSLQLLVQKENGEV
ncbi:MAG: GH116 family glycosyl-hydrolase [Candidatus Sumerlaeota bacterium]|nr:GH116 family glycosyl-hydrolase [Candidatus Sumerlaeota bacterium]